MYKEDGKAKGHAMFHGDLVSVKVCLALHKDQGHMRYLIMVVIVGILSNGGMQ